MFHELANYHGLKGYSFDWMNKRGKFNLAGYCNWKKKVIKLQPSFVERNHPFIVKRTLLHEIAHGLMPKHGHNSHWRKMAQTIGHSGNRSYGKEVKK